MKKELPLLLGLLAGAFALAEYYIPAAAVHEVQNKLLEFASVLAAAAFVLGAINVVQVNAPIIRRRRDDWPYKIVLIAGAALMAVVGIEWHTFGGPVEPAQYGYAPQAGPRPVVRVTADRADAEASFDGLAFVALGAGLARELEPGTHTLTVRTPLTGYRDLKTDRLVVVPGRDVSVRARLMMLWGPGGRVYTWLYDHVFAPCNATMFALLAFFIASAAFRAFRARNAEAALLLGAAILIMIGRVPIGRAMSGVFPEIADWIIDVPNNAGRRAIMMGAALGAVATSLRVILGLERSHLGKDQ